MTTHDLDSSDSLPVGRYIVLIREVETGGEGYWRFDINSCKDICVALCAYNYNIIILI